MNRSGTMTVGRILPKFVTPSDVRALKDRVNPTVVALDEVVRTCPTIADNIRTNWANVSKGWHAYYNDEDSWVHTAAQMDMGEAYERDLPKWQELIAQTCHKTAPIITPSNPSVLPNGGNGQPSSWPSAIKTVAIAGAAIALLFTIRSVIK